MTQVLDWRTTDDPVALVEQAVQALAAGGLVGLPTETVYGLAASAGSAEAVERVCESKGRPAQKSLVIALAEPAAVLDWAPDLSPLGRRLARRCWPGPFTLVVREGVERGLFAALPEEVRRRIAPEGTLGLRVPAHEATLEVLRQFGGPVVLTSANRSGEPAAVDAQEVVAAVGDDLALVIDAGPSQYGQASTVIRVAGERWEILRQGVASAEVLRQNLYCLIVFVCTGNTCRSPLAAALCQKVLAERLGCTVEQLPARGYVVRSAGLAAMPGGEATREAVRVAQELGADLSGHRSQPLTSELFDLADHVLAMTQGHVQVLANCLSRLGVAPRLLDASGADVLDPIGADELVYRDCAREILRHVERFVHELLASSE